MPVKQEGRAGTTGPHALTLGLFLAASSAPSPLYRLWEARWGFSPLMLTVVFAAYAFALLAALLLCGGTSDQVGRRPVILVAVAGEVAAMAGFLLARDVGWLLAARLLQGFSTGLATAALGAAILDADHARGPLLNAVVPMLGMGAGGLGSGLLVRWAPAPLSLVFAILVGLLAVQGARTAFAAETAPARTGRVVLRPRIAVPAQARGALLAATPATVALWALGGFSLSLLPSLLAAAMPGMGSLLGGAVVAVLTGGAVVAILLVRHRSPAVALPSGAGALALGTALILAGAHAGSPVLLLGGAAVAGLGFGAGWFGAVRSVLPLAPPRERAGLMSAFFVECYLANAVPVVAAGLLVRRIGLLRTADWFGAGIIALAVVAVAAAGARLAARRRETGGAEAAIGGRTAN